MIYTPRNGQCNFCIFVRKVLLHLDIDEISSLMDIYGKKRVKDVWKKELVIQGEHCNGLNNFLALIYFDIKNPRQYLKRVENKHLRDCEKGWDEIYGSTLLERQ